MRRLTVFLAAAVVARMGFHALYLPAFEGPDEPQHLARVMDFGRRPLGEAFAGQWVNADILASVLSHPCPRPEVGCPPYGQAPGLFNLLRGSPRPPVRRLTRIPNEEAKQPPLLYFLAGLPLRLARENPDPAAALLYVRLLDVGLVAIALLGPLRRLFDGSPDLAAAGLIAMLSPGASEAFARCSNDAAVFLWAAAVLAALDRRPRTLPLAILLAAGPMLKLTAVPVVAFALAELWREKRRGAAVVGAIGSGLVVPVQALRGWTAGGALELHRNQPAIAEPLVGWLTGFARTAYTMIKAPFWAMGWHLLRPPAALVTCYFGLLLSAALAVRAAPRPRRLAAHVAAALVAAGGTAVFAVAVRRYFGTWGGGTGWYAWDWSPWLVAAGRDLFVLERRFAPLLLVAEGLFVFAANLVWFSQSAAAYGG